MGFYLKLQSTVNKLISRYGQNAILRVMDSSVLPDEDKPWLPSEITGVEHSVKIVFIPDKLDNHEEVRYLKDTEIISGQINGYMATKSGVVPKAKDVVIRGSQLLTIDNITILNPGGINLFFKFEMGS